MDFGEAIKTCFNKYANFNGRATRPEFWWFMLFCFLALTAAGMLGRTVYGLAGLVLLLPGLAAGARRLHDTGKSGWFLLLNLVPMVGFIIVLVLCAQKTNPQHNEWGPVPGTAGETEIMPPGAM